MIVKELGGAGGLNGSKEFTIERVGFSISRNTSKPSKDGNLYFWTTANKDHGVFTDEEMLELFAAYLALKKEYDDAGT